jgi:hypothetical protein
VDQVTTLALEFGKYSQVHKGVDMNQVVGPTYLQPTQILPAPLFKLSLQLDF